MRRREFIAAGGAILAGATLGGSLARAGAPSDTIRTGVIGAGVRGQQLMDAMSRLPGFHVAAYCDVLPFRLEEARQFADRDAYGTADYRRILDDPSVDAVCIATTFSEHYRVAMDALDAGKHVYCEKTLVKGIDESLALKSRADESPHLIFQTGFQYQSSPLYRRAIELVRNGDIGDVAAIACQWNRNGDWRRAVPDPRWERQINWRMYREYSSGLVAELSAHQMDFCNRLVGSDVVSIQGFGGIDYWKDGRETYDNTHVTCRYASGITATFASLTSNSLNGYRVSVLGKKGSVILGTRHGWFVPEGESGDVPGGVDLVSGASVADGSQAAYQYSNASAAYRIDAPDDDPTPQALAGFGGAIVDGRQPVSGAGTGAAVAVMVQMSLDAMDTMTPQAWRPEYTRAFSDS